MVACDTCELFVRKYDWKIDEFYGECQHSRKIEHPTEFSFPCKYYRNNTTQLTLE